MPARCAGSPWRGVDRAEGPSRAHGPRRGAGRAPAAAGHPQREASGGARAHLPPRPEQRARQPGLLLLALRPGRAPGLPQPGRQDRVAEPPARRRRAHPQDAAGCGAGQLRAQARGGGRGRHHQRRGPCLRAPGGAATTNAGGGDAELAAARAHRPGAGDSGAGQHGEERHGGDTRRRRRATDGVGRRHVCAVAGAKPRRDARAGGHAGLPAPLLDQTWPRARLRHLQHEAAGRTLPGR